MCKTINYVINNIKKISNKIKPYLYLTNMILFILKIILFLITKSLFFVISSLYNLCIGLAKLKVYHNNYRKVGLFLVLASISFTLYSIWTILNNRVVTYDMYTSLLIATVTFFDIGIAIYKIIKERKKQNLQDKVIKLINLSTALISLELTQSAILSFTMKGIDNSLYNGILGVIVGTSTILIGIFIMRRTN